MTIPSSPPSPSLTRRAIRLRVGSAIVIFAAFLSHLGLILRPDDQMMGRPFIEDAFYSLSVARTLGAGGPMSVDGVSPTNGVQPLICFVYAPVFALAGSDTMAALRVVLVIDLALYVLAALAVGWFASLLSRDPDLRVTFFWLGAAVTLGSYSISIHTMNGLETGLALALTFAAVAFYGERLVGRDNVPWSDLARCGALLGLGVLARIDLAILTAAIAASFLISRLLRGDTFRGVGGAAVIGGVAFVVSLPWWAYNMIEFGHLMPISGLAQQDLFVDRLHAVAVVLKIASDSLLLTVHSPRFGGVAASVGFAIAAFALLMISAIRPGRETLRRVARTTASFEAEYLLPLALHLVVLTVYYTFFFGAPHFIERYLVAGRTLASTLFLIALALVYMNSRHRAPGFVVAAFMALAFVAGIVATSKNYTEPAMSANIHLNPADWIRRNVPPGRTVAMFQSGTTGFFSASVTNLDGKVNRAALAAASAGRLPQWTDSLAFDYIIDWDVYTRHIFMDQRVRSHYRPIDTLSYDFVVWKRSTDAN